MSRRRRRAPHANHERWLVSYADFITLLFAFFVVLYASSQVDKRKVGRLAMAIQVAFQEMGIFQASTTQIPMNVDEPMPFSRVQTIENLKRNASLAQVAGQPESGLGAGDGNGDLAKLQRELETALSAEIGRKEVSMRREPDGLVISLREVGFFESGSAQMKAASQPAFDHIAAILRERGYRLRIEGHTDNIPIHNARFASNWELSTARATEIIRLLIVRDGFDPTGLSAGGYGEYHPVASNQSMEGRAMNRRVDIVILRKDAASKPVPPSDPVASAVPAQTPSAIQKPSPAIPRPTAYNTSSR